MLQQAHVWTEDAHAEACEMWLEGRSQSQIADFFGISASAVAGYISRNRDAFPSRKGQQPAPRQNTVWTDERIAEASKLWREGRTIAELAKLFGVSDHAFNNVMRRYRDRFPYAREIGSRSKHRRRVVQPKRSAPVNLDNVFEKSKSNSAYDGRRFIISGQKPVSFASLEAKECKFPVSASDEQPGPEMACCGAPVEKGPYCSAHAAICWRVRA